VIAAVLKSRRVKPYPNAEGVNKVAVRARYEVSSRDDVDVRQANERSRGQARSPRNVLEKRSSPQARRLVRPPNPTSKQSNETMRATSRKAAVGPSVWILARAGPERHRFPRHERPLVAWEVSSPPHLNGARHSIESGLRVRELARDGTYRPYTNIRAIRSHSRRRTENGCPVVGTSAVDHDVSLKRMWNRVVAGCVTSGAVRVVLADFRASREGMKARPTHRGACKPVRQLRPSRATSPFTVFSFDNAMIVDIGCAKFISGKSTDAISRSHRAFIKAPSRAFRRARKARGSAAGIVGARFRRFVVGARRSRAEKRRRRTQARAVADVPRASAFLFSLASAEKSRTVSACKTSDSGKRAASHHPGASGTPPLRRRRAS